MKTLTLRQWTWRGLSMLALAGYAEVALAQFPPAPPPPQPPAQPCPHSADWSGEIAGSPVYSSSGDTSYYYDDCNGYYSFELVVPYRQDYYQISFYSYYEGWRSLSQAECEHAEISLYFQRRTAVEQYPGSGWNWGPWATYYPGWHKGRWVPPSDYYDRGYCSFNTYHAFQAPLYPYYKDQYRVYVLPRVYGVPRVAAVLAQR